MAMDPLGTAIDKTPNSLPERSLQHISGSLDIDIPIDFMGQIHPAKGRGYMKDYFIPGHYAVQHGLAVTLPRGYPGPEMFQFIPE